MEDRESEIVANMASELVALRGMKERIASILARWNKGEIDCLDFALIVDGIFDQPLPLEPQAERPKAKQKPVAFRRWDKTYPGGQWLYFTGSDQDGQPLYACMENNPDG